MRKHKPDLILGLLTIILMAIGLIIIYAIGPSWAQFQNSVNNTDYGSNFFFIKQLISVGVSLVAFFVAYKFRFDWVEKAGKWILLAGFILCAVMAIMGAAGSSLVNCAPGACRWLNLPLGFNLQPVEVVKIGILIYMAGLIARRQSEGLLEKREFWIPFALVMGLMVMFIGVIQKDLGSTAVITFMVLCMLVVSNMRFRFLGMILGIVAIAAVLLIVLFPHRLERLMSYSGDGDTHHIENALIAIGTGGLWGLGIGNSIQSTGYLPESLNDSIFAILGETFGFIGLMAIITLFTVLLLRLLKIATQLKWAGKQQDGSFERLQKRGVHAPTSGPTARATPHKDGRVPERFAQNLPPLASGYFVTIGVFAWLSGHVIINIMGMTAIIPMKGITLPFLSYGGTSMLFVAAAMGLCLQLSGWTKREVNNEDSSSRRGQRRTHHASSRRR